MLQKSVRFWFIFLTLTLALPVALDALTCDSVNEKKLIPISAGLFGYSIRRYLKCSLALGLLSLGFSVKGLHWKL